MHGSYNAVHVPPSNTRLLPLIRVCHPITHLSGRLNSRRLTRHRQDCLVLSGRRCELGITGETLRGELRRHLYKRQRGTAASVLTTVSSLYSTMVLAGLVIMMSVHCVRHADLPGACTGQIPRACMRQSVSRLMRTTAATRRIMCARVRLMPLGVGRG